MLVFSAEGTSSTGSARDRRCLVATAPTGSRRAEAADTGGQGDARAAGWGPPLPLEDDTAVAEQNAHRRHCPHHDPFREEDSPTVAGTHNALVAVAGVEAALARRRDRSSRHRYARDASESDCRSKPTGRSTLQPGESHVRADGGPGSKGPTALADEADDVNAGNLKVIADERDPRPGLGCRLAPGLRRSPFAPWRGRSRTDRLECGR
jgi:hypothetical protein